MNSNDPTIPFSRLSAFVRQITHDVRNGLNAIDLEAAFVTELVTDTEARDELKKLRDMVSNVAKSMQQLSASVAEPKLNKANLGAREFAEALRDRVAEHLAEHTDKIAWNLEIGGESLDVDFEQMTSALLEIIRNAFQFRGDDVPVELRVFIKENTLVFEQREQKTSLPSDPGSWGVNPLLSTRRGGYGLGLFRARRIIEAHDGAVETCHDGTLLTTRVALPLAKS